MSTGTLQTIHSVTPSRQAALDGWRAIAALLVLFSHTGFNPIPIWGFTGVHLFFVLSGYLVFKPFVKAFIGKASFPSFQDFYFRRFLRIYPPYAVALILCIVLRYATHSHHPKISSIINHILLVCNWGPDRSDFFGINIVFWSLSVEAQFYVLLPILAWLVYHCFRAHPQTALFGTVFLFIAIGVISRGFEFVHTENIASIDPMLPRFRNVFSFLDLFACGMFITAVEGCSINRRFLIQPPQWLVFTAGALVFVASNLWCTDIARGHWLTSDNFWFTLLFCPSACLGLGAILYGVINSNSIFERILAAWPLVYIGKISYSIYLFHILVQIPIFQLFPLTFISSYYLRTFCWGLISLMPTLVVAASVYRLIEAPSLQLSAHFKTWNSSLTPSHIMPTFDSR